MSNFFEKLKKGMGEEINPKEQDKTVNEEILEEIEKNDEIIEKEKTEQPPVKKVKEKKPRKPKKAKTEENMPKEKPARDADGDKIKIETNEEENLPPEASKDREETEEEKSFEPKGELAVDVYQTEKDFVIQSAIAGVKPEEIDILIEDDMIIIKGTRKKPSEEKADYFCQECFWGPFLKEIILPVEVDPGRAESVMKDGILTIRMPKINREKRKKIVVSREK